MGVEEVVEAEEVALGVEAAAEAAVAVAAVVAAVARAHVRALALLNPEPSTRRP